MPAYSIAICTVNDQEKYQEYAKAAGPAVAKFGGKFVARCSNPSVMEGRFDYEKMIIVEFPDVETAKRYFNSPEYQQARSMRLGAADFNLIIFET
ncbi:MAG: DUF1330 domain-containing protein [Betaproteobacteria bacterium]|nr:DUF1330 domain-containing protein [Betaproteobacteria bacterium]